MNIYRSLFRSIFQLFFIVFSSSLFAQQEQVMDIQKDLDAYIDSAIKEWNVPGLAIAIVKDGKIEYIKGFGTISMDSDEKVDKNTIFMIASNTKAFTATALGLLEYDGLCSFDDPVSKWNPRFKLYDKKTQEQLILSDLLSHRLGLQTFQGDFMYFYSNMTLDNAYAKYELLEPRFPFRTHYGYSNFGYQAAGDCIESISGVSWDRFIENRILKPLEMNRTQMLSVNAGTMENTAIGHTFDDFELTAYPHTNIDLIGPAASMSSSVADLSNWMIAQLNNGMFNDTTIIPPSVIAQTRKPQTIIRRARHSFNNTNFSLYGLGWNIQDYENKEIISHTGGIWGFVSSVNLVPEMNLGVVILTNSDENWLYEAIKWEVIDAYLGLPERNYAGLYLNYYKRTQNNKRAELEELKSKVLDDQNTITGLSAYEGKYFSPVYGTINLTLKESFLEISFEHHPQLIARLYPIGNDQMLCLYTPTRFGFHIFDFDPDSKSFDLSVSSRLESTTYKFTKQERIFKSN